MKYIEAYMELLCENIYKITALISGFSIMVLELTSSRILAPYVGTSFFVWTNIIGVIMASLSLGYYLGGKISKNPSNNVLSSLIFATSIWVLAISIAYTKALPYISHSNLDIRLSSFFASFILFAIPSILLGTVSPYLAQLTIKSVQKSGKVVGELYALSTLGSILGTFLTGFYLISAFGIDYILVLIAIILMANNILIRIIHQIPLTKFVIFFITLLAFALFIKEKNSQIETRYNTVEIYQSIYNHNPIKIMRINGVINSAIYNNSNELVFPYLEYYDLATFLNPGSRNILMIGGAGYSYPMHFLSKNLNTNMEVVEIDPQITQLARKYFNLRENKNLVIYNEDGRVFLNNNKKLYDSILIDAFSSYNIPYNLITLEAIREMDDSLTQNGVIIANIISARSGDKSKVAKAIYKTFKTVFPQTFILLVNPEAKDDQLQNLMLISLKSTHVNLNSKNKNFSTMLGNIWKEKTDADLPILTDNYAPIDQYMLPIYSTLTSFK